MGTLFPLSSKRLAIVAELIEEILKLGTSTSISTLLSLIRVTIGDPVLTCVPFSTCFCVITPEKGAFITVSLTSISMRSNAAETSET